MPSTVTPPWWPNAWRCWPFETRQDLHASQQRLLDQPAPERLRMVLEAAALYSGGMTKLIG